MKRTQMCEILFFPCLAADELESMNFTTIKE